MLSKEAESLIQGWISLADDHWKEFQPKRYKRLKKDGTLRAALKRAANLTYQEMIRLESLGYQRAFAWIQVCEMFLLLPEEEPPIEENLNSGARLCQEVLSGEPWLVGSQWEEEEEDEGWEEGEEGEER